MAEFGVKFGNVKLIKADMVMTNGASPSVCMATAILEELKESDGELIFSKDRKKLIRFKDCKIRNAYARPATSNQPVKYDLEIVDRRWKWRHKTVSGRFNVRTLSGKIIKETESKWEDIFHHVLKELGEEQGQYRLDLQLDNKNPGTFEWENMRGDLVLAELAEATGCLICLQNNDKLIIERIGNGPSYPWTRGQRIPVVNFKSEEVPQNISIEFAPTIWQTQFTCKAAAYNIDGSLTFLEDADWIENFDTFCQHFVPGAGWSELPGIVDSYEAKRTFIAQVDILFRMHKIWWPEAGRVLPGGQQFDTVEDILPLLPRNLYRPIPHYKVYANGLFEPEMLDTEYEIDNPNIGGSEITAMAWGSFGWSGTWGSSGGNGYNAGVGHHVEGDSFIVDRALGTITFKYPLFYGPYYWYGTESPKYEEQIHPAFVQMWACHNGRKDGTSALYRHEFGKSEKDPEGRKVVIRRDDVALYNIGGRSWGSSPDRGLTNKHKLDTEIGPSMVEAYRASYNKALDTAFVEWTGLRDYSVRGNVPMMRWHIGQEDVFTQGGKNIEHPTLTPTYSERRRIEVS